MSPKTKKQPLRHSFWGEDKFPVGIAHRGGGALYGTNKHRKENTLEAFLAASKLGYKYLEMDVIASSDGEVVILHVAKNRFESLLDKKDAPNSKQLQMMTYVEMKRVLGREIPTLQQALLSFPDTKFLIDAKSEEVVQPLARIIIDSKAQKQVCLGSFYPRRVEKLRQLLGSGVCLRLVISRSPWHLRNQLGYLRNKAWQQTNSVYIVDWPYIFINKWIVKLLHNQNLRVLAWVPNSRSSIKRALNADADGVISDRPEMLKEILGSQGTR